MGNCKHTDHAKTPRWLAESKLIVAPSESQRRIHQPLPANIQAWLDPPPGVTAWWSRCNRNVGARASVSGDFRSTPSHRTGLVRSMPMPPSNSPPETA